MKKIGLISDTHGFIIPQVFEFFGGCDEIWHAGDIGSYEVAQKLENFKAFRAVSGNIDGAIIRSTYPEICLFQIESFNIAMMHIGGYPGKYSSGAKALIEREKPDIFIAGHSHILKIMFDKKNNLMYMNPGAAGKQGLHQKITMLRFKINRKNICELEVFEALKS